MRDVLIPAGVAQQMWPPTLEGLLSWTATFRHHKTVSNYLGYARTGCLLAGADDAVFNAPLLKRAKVSHTMSPPCSCLISVRTPVARSR